MVDSSENDSILEKGRKKSRKHNRNKSSKSRHRHGNSRQRESKESNNEDEKRHIKPERSRKRNRNNSDSSVSSNIDSKRRSTQREKNSTTESDDSSSCEDRKRRRKDPKKSEKHRKRKEKKSKKRKSKKRSKRDHDYSSDSDEEIRMNQIKQMHFTNNFLLADSLYNLFENHPVFVEDLPILLVKLAGGTTFDLRQMPDGPGQALSGVFECLKPFGVTEESGSWKWNNPSTNSRPNANQELVLIKVVRSMLDEIGITMKDIEEFENPNCFQNHVSPLTSHKTNRTEILSEENNRNTRKSDDVSLVEQKAISLLQQFRKSNGDKEELANELAGLCQMILQGESISLDGLPDKNLRDALESLFEICGLEKSELEDDEEESGDKRQERRDAEHGNREENNNPTFGYGLPEVDDTNAKLLVLSLMDACRGKLIAPLKRPIQGPARPPTCKDSGNASSDDEGPLQFGNETIQTGLTAQRVREAETATGNLGPVREEWMLVPGKFDFLSAIKSGQPIRSRGFEGKRKAQSEIDHHAKPVDPLILAQINAMRQAQEEARGPSLMELHRKQKAEEKEAANDNKQGKRRDDWKWNRDNDLDAGRRVDKEALNMILGGAGKELKTKFQGGSL